MKKIVGVFDNEVYLYAEDNNSNMCFSVARIVAADMLEDLRDVTWWMSERRVDWVNAAEGGYTDDSLEDYMQSLLCESDVYSDSEAFPFKDECRELQDTEERKIIDKWIEDNTDIKVGTWEMCGWYTPKSSFVNKEFNGFDLVLDEELAERYYKEIGLK